MGTGTMVQWISPVTVHFQVPRLPQPQQGDFRCCLVLGRLLTSPTFESLKIDENLVIQHQYGSHPRNPDTVEYQPLKKLALSPHISSCTRSLLRLWAPGLVRCK
jgi:hypothetical protein